MNTDRKLIGIAMLGALATLAGCFGSEDQADGLRSHEAELSEKPVRFIGESSDWFDPRNWDAGRVPGPDDDVLIGGGAWVVIDPKNDAEGGATAGSVPVQDIWILEDSHLETQPGTELSFDTLVADDQATFFAYASTWQGNHIPSATGGYDCPRWQCGYNPSHVDIEHYELDTGSLALYLGGTKPAGAGATGPGHYAAIRGGTIDIIDTELLVDVKYGFAPRPGDRFVIVKARKVLDGTFNNLAHGDEVLRTGDVRLVISYEKNQVVLIAESL